MRILKIFNPNHSVGRGNQPVKGVVYDIYNEYIPNYVQEIIQTSLFQRLKDVGMNCGMEYTQFEPFRNCKGVSRYNHSIGVALITYHFTHDMHQTVAALLHDIAMPSEIGPREEHNVYGAKIADELLTKLNYPDDRKERVKECVLRHRGSNDLPRNTIEEECVADADVIAHFDCIPALFHLAFGKNDKDLSIAEGTEFVKRKLERDYNKLSSHTREILKDRYENIIKVLFVEK